MFGTRIAAGLSPFWVAALVIAYQSPSAGPATASAPEVAAAGAPSAGAAHSTGPAWRPAAHIRAPGGDIRIAQWRPEDGSPAQATGPGSGAGAVRQPRWESDTPEARWERRLRPASTLEERFGLPAPAPAPAPAETVRERAYVPPEPSPLADARVVVHRPSSATYAEARDLLDLLRARGVGEAEIRTVGVTVSRANVRYFHDRDRAAAERVVRLLEGDGYRAELKDFTHYRPPPSRGTVEVWLPG